LIEELPKIKKDKKYIACTHAFQELSRTLLNNTQINWVCSMKNSQTYHCLEVPSNHTFPEPEEQ
jgi:hypothetical protein